MVEMGEVKNQANYSYTQQGYTMTAPFSGARNSMDYQG